MTASRAQQEKRHYAWAPRERSGSVDGRNPYWVYLLLNTRRKASSATVSSKMAMTTAKKLSSRPSGECRRRLVASHPITHGVSKRIAKGCVRSLSASL